MSLRVVPLSLAEANDYIALHHRHHKPVRGHKFSIAAKDPAGTIVGVAVVGRPVARGSDNGATAEVTRLCTEGGKNVCSFLYGASARVAKEMGYDKVQTYILEEEQGISLKASGWVQEAITRGGSWGNRPGRREDQPQGRKTRWARPLR